MKTETGVDVLRLDVSVDKPELRKHAVEHWASARIDLPLQTLGRLDETARQLITIGGILVTLMVAIIATSGRQLSPYAVLSMASLLAMFGCCSTVLYHQSKYLGVKSLFISLQDDVPAGRRPLGEEVDVWCADTYDVVQAKKKWLLLAMLFFCLSLFATVLCLAVGMGVDWGALWGGRPEQAGS